MLLKYQDIRVGGNLSPYLQSFWRYEHGSASRQYTILPDGCFDLILEFRDNALHLIKLTGLWTTPVNIAVKSGNILFGVRCKLLAAEYLFNISIKDLLNTSKELPLTFWNLQSFSANDFDGFVHYVTSWCNDLLANSAETDPRKVKLFELVYTLKVSEVQELAQSVFWSSRQMNRYFNQQFGIPLKTFIKVVRCKSTYTAISKGYLNPSPMYHDQSHFIKEVRELTGSTPKKLYKNQNDRFLQLSKKKDR